MFINRDGLTSCLCGFCSQFNYKIWDRKEDIIYCHPVSSKRLDYHDVMDSAVQFCDNVPNFGPFLVWSQQPQTTCMSTICARSIPAYIHEWCLQVFQMPSRNDQIQHVVIDILLESLFNGNNRKCESEFTLYFFTHDILRLKSHC